MPLFETGAKDRVKATALLKDADYFMVISFKINDGGEADMTTNLPKDAAKSILTDLLKSLQS